MTSRYDPYGMGYRRATKTFTKWSNTFLDFSFYNFALFKLKLKKKYIKIRNKEELIIKES